MTFLWFNWMIISSTIIPFVLINLNNWREVNYVSFFRYTALLFFPTALLLQSFEVFDLLIFAMSYFPLLYLCAQDLKYLEVTIHSLLIAALMHFICILSVTFLEGNLDLIIENILLMMLILVCIKIIEWLRRKNILGAADPVIIVISILGLTFEQSILWLFLVSCMPIIFYGRSLRKSLSTKIPFIPFCVSAKLFAILIYG